MINFKSFPRGLISIKRIFSIYLAHQVDRLSLGTDCWKQWRPQGSFLDVSFDCRSLCHFTFTSSCTPGVRVLSSGCCCSPIIPPSLLSTWMVSFSCTHDCHNCRVWGQESFLHVGIPTMRGLCHEQGAKYQMPPIWEGLTSMFICLFPIFMWLHSKSRHS